MEIIMPTPLLDEISIRRWFTTTYSIGQQKEIENLLLNHIWVTKKKVQIRVKEMTTNHINNCIRCWLGYGRSHIPPDYLGGKQKWLEIFQKEIISRR